jgi:carbamoyltransferase
MNILGMSAFYHDSSCSLLRDGELICAASEERFSRIKHDHGLPSKAFRFCLERAGVEIGDIDCVSYYEDPKAKLSRQLWMRLSSAGPPKFDLVPQIQKSRVEQTIRYFLGYEGPIQFVEHHQAHAASAYYFSGFEHAAIMTVDGVGEWATASYGRGRGSELELFEEVHFPHSLGLLYSTLTSYLGFEVNDGEYKVMGLAPYGEPRFVDEIRKLVRPGDEGQFQLDLNYFDFFGGERMYSERLQELLGQPPREPETEFHSFHFDVARSLQCVLEEILLQKVRYLHSQVPDENLCLAGGVALNCVANSRILRDGPFKRLFVQPAAGDAGGALGAAALAHVKRTGCGITPRVLNHVYLGPEYSVNGIARLLEVAPDVAYDFRNQEERLLEAVVQRLAQGKVIGWFHGPMEFGPRALGGRSILADPRIRTMRDRINLLVKKRESFRPFAPTVLADCAAEHFALDHPSPFMLEIAQVRSKIDLPAITHVDGSARVQTVDGDSNPRFYRLLQSFNRATGCPILLNTSFNLRGEPIVCSPVDAICCFIQAKLDTLVMEDFLIDQERVPARWRELAPRPHPQKSLVHEVYTLL